MIPPGTFAWRMSESRQRRGRDRKRDRRVTVGAEDLYQVVMLRRLSELLMKRIHWNYRFIVGFNSALIALGVTGVLMPTTSAMLHNTSTLAISLKSMQNLL